MLKDFADILLDTCFKSTTFCHTDQWYPDLRFVAGTVDWNTELR